MKNIDQIVKQLVKKYKTSNPYELCDLLGINVELEYIGTLEGYYHYFNRIKQIRLNTTLDDCQRKFTCVHELGHAILHPRINTLFLSQKTYTVTPKYENEANAFAQILLTYESEIYIC